MFWAGLAAGAVTLGIGSVAAALEFSAERQVKSQGKLQTAQINFKDDRWRLEFAAPEGRAMAAIYRADLRLVWFIHSRERQYLEVPMKPDDMVLVEERFQGEVSRDLIGTEELNGYPTELFEVMVSRGGEKRQYYQWVTVVERFPIKIVRKNDDWSVEYRRLIFARQPGKYFEPPFAYSLVKPAPDRRAP